MIKLVSVILIMVVANLFMVFAIIRAASRLENTIRRYYLSRLGEEEVKIREQKAPKEDLIITREGNGEEGLYPEEAEGDFCVEKGLGSQKETVHLMAPVAANADLGSARFKSSSFREDYRIIRRMALLNRQAALRRVMDVQKNEKPQRSVFRELAEILDYDTVFRMSLCTPGQQESLLKECLTPEQFQAAEDLVAGSKKFDVLELYNHLKEKAFLQDNTFYVYAAQGEAFPVPAADGVNVQSDDSIVEGVRIVYRNKLYDYSI